MLRCRSFWSFSNMKKETTDITGHNRCWYRLELPNNINSAFCGRSGIRTKTTTIIVIVSIVVEMYLNIVIMCGICVCLTSVIIPNITNNTLIINVE